MMPQAPAVAGEHPVDEYVAIALSQNPQIQARRQRVEAAAQKVPQAAALKDPMVGVTVFPFYPYVQQTAGGRMQTELMVSQEIPWKGKLRAQADAAEAEVNMARAELAAAEFEVIEQVKRAYFELYFVQRSIEITSRSRGLAVQFRDIAEAKYRAAQVSQQDLLRADLEISNVDTELVRLHQQLQSGQARLARLLHVSPDTPVRTVAELPQEAIPDDLQRLYERAIAARPELHAQLAAVQRDRFNVELARLQYFPDVTPTFGWGAMTSNRALSPVADGLDNLTIGVSANVPIYRGKLNAGVREAEAATTADAREYDNLRDRTQEEVLDLFAQVTSQQELLRLFREEILPKADQTLKVSIAAYESGQVDLLQLIDNWQELLRYQIMQQRLETQLRQSMASLERTVGGFAQATAVPEPIPLPQPMPSSVDFPPPVTNDAGNRIISNERGP